MLIECPRDDVERSTAPYYASTAIFHKVQGKQLARGTHGATLLSNMAPFKMSYQNQLVSLLSLYTLFSDRSRRRII